MLKILVLAVIAGISSLGFSQVNNEKLQNVVQQIKSSDRAPTPEQQAAFNYVFENFAREPEKTPPVIQDALTAYLEKVANSEDTGARNVGRDYSELPLKIALTHSGMPQSFVLQKLVLRKDISLGARLRSIEQLKRSDANDALTSVGKTLMKYQDKEDRYLAATAFTSLRDYDKAVAEFLVNELASDKTSRISVIFEADEQKLNQLYHKVAPQGKEKLQRLYPTKAFN